MPVKWLLLACFAMQAITGFGQSRLALCLGCPDTGVSMVRAAADAPDHGASHCCAPEHDEHPAPGDEPGHSECGCFDVAFEVSRVLALAQPRVLDDGLVSLHAIGPPALDAPIDVTAVRDAPSRSWLDLGALPRAQTPLAQRTLLLI